MNPINVLMATDAITKTGTLAMNFHIPVGEANPHIHFGYDALKFFNYTQGKVSGSMNYYPINMIQTSQKSIKEGLNEYLQGYFRISK